MFPALAAVTWTPVRPVPGGALLLSALPAPVPTAPPAR